jgi:hypothetical protein
MLIAGTYDFDDWKEKFVKYIEASGNKPSVAKDYAGRIQKILEEENLSIQTLARDIDQWIAEYKTGKYAAKNKAKHYAPSSALVKLKDFIPTLYTPYLKNQYETFKGFASELPADLLF